MCFLVEYDSIRRNPEQINMLTNALPPQTSEQLRSYFGLLQFYLSMLSYLSHAVYKLYTATCDNV